MKQPQTQSKKVHQPSLHNSHKVAGKNTEKIPEIFPASTPMQNLFVLTAVKLLHPLRTSLKQLHKNWLFNSLMAILIPYLNKTDQSKKWHIQNYMVVSKSVVPIDIFPKICDSFAIHLHILVYREPYNWLITWYIKSLQKPGSIMLLSICSSLRCRDAGVLMISA